MNRQGFTVPELMIGMAIMAVCVGGLAAIIKTMSKTTVQLEAQVGAQQEVRDALIRVEEVLLHANEVRVASSTFIEFVVDIDQDPGYDADGDLDFDGIPNFRDPDRDNDANALLPAATQWLAGFNLKDDDENGDGNLDCVRRIYLSGSDLWLDSSSDGSPWGAASRRRLAANVTSFSMSVWGSKGNNLGRNIDLNGDGVISSSEMDGVTAPSGMGNANGALDLANERRYITSIRIGLGLDRNKDGKTDYDIETDVYPPLLAVKSQ